MGVPSAAGVGWETGASAAGTGGIGSPVSGAFGRVCVQKVAVCCLLFVLASHFSGGGRRVVSRSGERKSGEC